MALRRWGKRLVFAGNRLKRFACFAVAMDTLSSSDLDSPSKTPLFIGIAAVIIALIALGLGWVGFSRSNAFERKLAELEAGNQEAADLQATVSALGSRLDGMANSMSGLSGDVNDVLSNVGSDISKIKNDIRKVMIEAGTARRMVEELEKKGVRAAAPAPARTASGSDGKNATPAGPGGTYTIKSGDTLGKIAAAYKITLSQLQAANPGVDPRRLRIGQQIVIPGN